MGIIPHNEKRRLCFNGTKNKLFPVQQFGAGSAPFVPENRLFTKSSFARTAQ